LRQPLDSLGKVIDLSKQDQRVIESLGSLGIVGTWHLS
jgi:hypothetical protein